MVNSNHHNMLPPHPNDIRYSFSYSAIRAIDSIINIAANTNIKYGFYIVEIENFAQLLLIHENELLQQLMSELIDHINMLDSNLSAILVNREHILIIYPRCNDYDHLNDLAMIIFDHIHNFGFIKKRMAVFFHPIIGGTLYYGDLNIKSPEILDQCFVALKIANTEDYKGFCSYKDALMSQSRLREEIAQANFLHEAIEKNKLKLAYQPVINAKTGEIAYYECLLRLINPHNKLISAGPFIGMAEKFSFVHLVDEIVMSLVAGELLANPDIKLSFNLSAVCFHKKNILAMLQHLVGEYPTLANRMIVEITETALMSDMGQVLEFSKELRKYGCKIALDDFGAGYTSFKQLKDLDVDVVKIDGSYIRELDKNKDSLIFVKVLIEICQKFNFKSVAEFVETETIAKMLIDMGIDYLQGHFFSPALNFKPWSAKKD